MAGYPASDQPLNARDRNGSGGTRRPPPPRGREMEGGGCSFQGAGKKKAKSKQGRRSVGVRYSVLTFAIIAKAHLGLAKTDCVLSGADAIELFQLVLVDILQVVRTCQRFRRSEGGEVGELKGAGSGSSVPQRQGKGLKTHLAGEVDLDGLDADILRTGGHGGLTIGYFGEIYGKEVECLAENNVGKKERRVVDFLEG